MFAFLGSLYDPSAREKAPHWGGSAEEIPASKSRRSRAAADQTLKMRPKNGIEFRTAFGPQNVAKSIPKSLQKLTKILHFSVFVSVTFSSLFLNEFLVTFIVPALRFDCYLQCFREVQHFSRGLENSKKYIQKTIKITPKTHPKPIKNQSKNRR